jgi:DMSO/TMAO reductase YedYZ heme-binding membrane subunit
MLGFIALPVLLVLVIASFAIYRRARTGREPWHFLRDLSPVSGQWLADYRRAG